MRKGNKQNAMLNGEYAFHVRRFGKKLTAKKRRQQSKKLANEKI